MRPKVFLFILFLCAASLTHAQDVIHFTNGTEEKVIVKSVNSQTINYNKPDNPEGPIYTVYIKTVDHISMADGTEKTYSQLHYKAGKAYYRKERQVPITELLQLKLAPSSLFDPWGATLPVSLQYNLGSRFALEATAAIPLFFNTIGGKYYGIQVTGIKQDEKFVLSCLYYPYSRKNLRMLIGTEFFYRHQLISLGSGRIDEGGPVLRTHEFLYFRSSDLLKNYFGGGLRIGISQKIANDLWIDAYGGLGVLGGASWHKNLQGTSTATASAPPIFNSNNVNIAEGSVKGLYIPLAIRVSYCIGQHKK